MNIANQVALAITTFLQTQTIPNAPTVINGLTTDLNDETQSRVIVVGTGAELRKASLPGLFDVSGTVNVIQSVDDSDGETRFSVICDSVESILGGKYGMPLILEGIDSDLKIYSYQWLGSSLAASTRKFMATYNWTAFTRNSPTTTT